LAPGQAEDGARKLSAAREASSTFVDSFQIDWCTHLEAGLSAVYKFSSPYRLQLRTINLKEPELEIFAKYRER
jgi:hypothetical protein